MAGDEGITDATLPANTLRCSGNFLSQDTYRGDATVPPSLHRYVYALNNPVRYVDPNGNTSTGAPPTVPIDEGDAELMSTTIEIAAYTAFAIALFIPFAEFLWPAIVGGFLEFAAEITILLGVGLDVYEGLATLDAAELSAAISRGEAVFVSWATVPAIIQTAEAIPQNAALALVWTYRHCDELEGPEGSPIGAPDARTIACAVVLWLFKVYGLI